MSVNDKVYVITKGDYSDYSIYAVTLDKQRARKLAKLLSNKYDKAQVEEYPLDELQQKRRYLVTFEDGEKPTVQLVDYDDFYTQGIHDPKAAYKYGDCGPIEVTVFTMDEEHALKIAEDKRAELLARRAGITI